jgi:hypothetical protein
MKCVQIEEAFTGKQLAIIHDAFRDVKNFGTNETAMISMM